MSLITLAAFAGAIFILFLTPGPGNIAMVGRTLDAGPSHGVTYGLGILTGDIFWLTLAVFGLAAAAEVAGEYAQFFWIAKIIGAGILLWFAWGAFQGWRNPAPADAPLAPVSKRGLVMTYAAGVAMPLTNPKPIIFYLTFLPAFFDLTVVGPLSYLAMIGVMGAM
jgi:threonine/homoserine/homoserine lactone efflux protein